MKTATLPLPDCREPRRTLGASAQASQASALPLATERAEQAALAQWLKVAAPAGLYWTAIPAGDGRMTRTPGYRSGTPDMLCIWKGRPILIEMKRRKRGRTSDDQHDAHQAITLAGGVVFVAKGWEAAAEFLRSAVKGAA